MVTTWNWLMKNIIFLPLIQLGLHSYLLEYYIIVCIRGCHQSFGKELHIHGDISMEAHDIHIMSIYMLHNLSGMYYIIFQGTV